MSLEGPKPGKGFGFDLIIKNAIAAGIVVVTSAGNGGSGVATSPCGYVYHGTITY
jgi:hypothetical protein